MTPITWKNVNAPNNAAAVAFSRTGADLLSSAFDSGANLFNQLAQREQQKATNQGLQNILQASSLDQLNQMSSVPTGADVATLLKAQSDRRRLLGSEALNTLKQQQMLQETEWYPKIQQGQLDKAQAAIASQRASEALSRARQNQLAQQMGQQASQQANRNLFFEILDDTGAIQTGPNGTKVFNLEVAQRSPYWDPSMLQFAKDLPGQLADAQGFEQQKVIQEFQLKRDKANKPKATKDFDPTTMLNRFPSIQDSVGVPGLGAATDEVEDARAKAYFQQKMEENNIPKNQWARYWNSSLDTDWTGSTVFYADKLKEALRK